jgi:hypothetical protein
MATASKIIEIRSKRKGRKRRGGEMAISSAY